MCISYSIYIVVNGHSLVICFLCDSKSDFVIYKLKEMGKIDEKDIAMISDQFDQLEFGNCERIPLMDIIGKL